MLRRLFIGTGTGDGQVTVRLLSGDRLHFRRYEMPRVMLHPQILLYNFLLVIFLMMMDARADMESLSTTQRLLMALICAVASIGLIFLMSLAYEHFVAGRKGGVSPHASPFNAVGTALGLVVVVFCYSIFKPEVVMTLPQIVTLWAFFYVLAEVQTHLLMYRVVPKVVRALRAADGLRAVPDAVAGPVVEIGGHVFPAAALLRIEAEGNYLRVVTDAGRHLLPGPFGRTVDALPAGLGQRVGRSAWVASAAVAAVRLDGRELVLRLRDGAEVRVAQARRKAVEDWARRLVQGRATSTQSG